MTPDSFRYEDEEEVLPPERPTPIPISLKGGLLGVVKMARGLSSDVVNTQLDLDEIFLETRRRLKKISGIDDNSIIDLVSNHVKAFPREPKDGFENVNDLKGYVTSVNAIMAAEKALYNADPADLRLRDPDYPNKYRSHILTECADGRNSITLFLPKEKLFGRFDFAWLPMAGAIVFPEIEVPKSPEEIAQHFSENDELRKKMFSRLDLMYGPKVEESLLEYREGKLARVFIEFQSHFESRNPNHGCGAHKSDLAAAQLETIKDCLVTEEWIKDRYPEEYKKNVFRVFRTTHDTGDGGPIYSAKLIDNTQLPEGKKQEHASLFSFAARRYEAPMAKDREMGIIRKYHWNPIGLETEKHDEQSIRISNTHFASTLEGQSVLETSWIEDPQNIFEHVKVLLGIIEGHYRKRHPDKPAIIHFDIVKGNEKIRQVYEDLKSLIFSDPDLRKRVNDGTLQLLTTETDRHTYQMFFPDEPLEAVA